jgi:hypothetical protein
MNIGFYLTNISSQDIFIRNFLSTINDLCSLRPYDNIVIFNSKYDIVDVDHKYYVLHINQAKYFDGILFVFDTVGANLTKTFPAPKKQILIIKDQEWSNKLDSSYMYWHNIYHNFDLLVNNKDMYNLCSLCWKTPIASIEYNAEGINNVIQSIR